jgi:hypothetical protein
LWLSLTSYLVWLLLPGVMSPYTRWLIYIRNKIQVFLPCWQEAMTVKLFISCIIQHTLLLDKCSTLLLDKCSTLYFRILELPLRVTYKSCLYVRSSQNLHSYTCQLSDHISMLLTETKVNYAANSLYFEVSNFFLNIFVYIYSTINT